MKNLSRYPKYKLGKCYLEIIDTEIVDRHIEYKLPRHISSLEIKSHRCELNKAVYTPIVCNLATYPPKATNSALDILKYQLSDRGSRQKHLENILRNLERRLQVAKARGNNQLVSVLQEEFKQLEISS